MVAWGFVDYNLATPPKSSLGPRDRARSNDAIAEVSRRFWAERMALVDLVVAAIMRTPRPA